MFTCIPKTKSSGYSGIFCHALASSGDGGQGDGPPSRGRKFTLLVELDGDVSSAADYARKASEKLTTSLQGVRAQEV